MLRLGRLAGTVLCFLGLHAIASDGRVRFCMRRDCGAYGIDPP